MRVLFLLVLLLTQNSYAQSVLRLQHLNVEDGLSQSSVYSTFQDAHGFIWFATGDGLNRYDGSRFLPYKSRITDSLPGALKDRNINSTIVEDRLNRLWFTSDAGVYCLDLRTGKFDIVINKHETGSAAVIAGIDTGFLWVAVPRKGIYSIAISDRKCRLFPFTDNYQTNQQELTVIINGCSMGRGVWLADTKGLLYFDKQTLRDKRIALKDGINSIAGLRDSTIILTTRNGIWHYFPATGRFEYIPVPVPGTQSAAWKSLAEDTISHLLYIGESAGSHVCKIDLLTNKYELLSIPTSYIDRLFIDRSQNLWVGTDGDGVYKLDVKPQKFFCYAPRAGTSENFMVKSIYRDDSGYMWLGVFNEGLVRYNPISGIRQNIPLREKGSTDHLICTITHDTGGDMVVSENGTILWLDPLNGKIRRQLVLPVYRRIAAAAPLIYALVEWKKDHYLVGTNIGLYIVNAENNRMTACMPAMFLADSLVNGWTYNLFKSADGNIYIGQRRGFAQITMISDSAYKLIEYGFSNLPIRHFYKSTLHPVLWLASEQGLIAYNELTKKSTVFDEATGLTNSYIYAILPQDDTTLWISTNNGLYTAKIHYTAGGITAQFMNYTSKDGLQSNEFNTGAYFRGSDGTLIFGGIAGINWFRPAAIRSNPYKPVPVITEIAVNDSIYAGHNAFLQNKLELSYESNTISLTFKALEFTRPEQNSFAYKLEGLDKDWVYTATDKIRYSNLPPGNYRFLLKARNNESTWNDEPLVLSIIINPPYWETWWFRSLCILVVASMIFAISRYYIHQKVLVKTRELEKQHALNMERLRISKDVHDDIGSGLSKISLISALANNKLDGNIHLGKDIYQISSISKELVDNMRDLIWVLNPDNTTLDNLISRIREYCADYLDGTGIAGIFDFPDNIPARAINREVQRNIFSTIKEAVNNCVKHSGATEIVIALSTDNDVLSIRITDNGSGISDSTKGSGNGLRNMKYRIESIGGQFAIQAPSGSGATISIAIPFARIEVSGN
jgi:signal transduction histidine kinase/ligand-binding sensor domain-containing protein